MKDITDVEFTTQNWLLKSTKVCFKRPLKRREKEEIDKCLRKQKFKILWNYPGCVVIKK